MAPDRLQDQPSSKKFQRRASSESTAHLSGCSGVALRARVAFWALTSYWVSGLADFAPPPYQFSVRLRDRILLDSVSRC